MFRRMDEPEGCREKFELSAPSLNRRHSSSLQRRKIRYDTRLFCCLRAHEYCLDRCIDL